MSPILNYTTKVPAEQSATQIQRMLAKAGAKAVVFEYDRGGEINGLAWQSETPAGVMPFALPVRVDRIDELLRRDRVHITDTMKRSLQARRTAWRQLKDWIEAQLALLATEMVRIDELFLPFARTRSGSTVYEALREGGFGALALTDGGTK